MPARIMLVHNDPMFVEAAVEALQTAGCSVAAFSEPIHALKTLSAAQSVDLLITRILFQPGQPNGVALALMTKSGRPEAQVIFVAGVEMRAHNAGVGRFLPMPLAPTRLINEVRHVLEGVASRSG